MKVDRLAQAFFQYFTGGKPIFSGRGILFPMIPSLSRENPFYRAFDLLVLIKDIYPG
jgi:hypothetical protein